MLINEIKAKIRFINYDQETKISSLNKGQKYNCLMHEERKVTNWAF